MEMTTNEEEMRAWLRGVPDQMLFQEAGRRRRSRVVNLSGGRPKVLRPCPVCKVKMGARELLRHKCPRKSLTTALPPPEA